MVERYPNLKEEVGGLIPCYEVSSLLDKDLPCGQLPHVLSHWHVGLLSQKRKEKEKENVDLIDINPLFEFKI